MQAGSTSSGIQAVGEIPWGSHFCQFYKTRDDLADSLVPYFKAGLLANERCLWITSEPFGVEDARSALKAAVPDLDRCLARGQIEILDHREWYTRNGEADAESVLCGWVQRQEKALVEGYSGLRLTGNTFWLESKDWRDFVDYETRVSERFKARRIVALCSYCLGRCNSEEVLDVVRNHQFAVARRDGDWEILEAASIKVAKEELRRLNDELEQRVDARTAELKQALQMRDEFLSTASHELKTPLASLQLYVDGLLRSQQARRLEDDEIRRRLTKVRSQCGRLDTLINDLLDVSRAGEGRVPLRPAEVDLAELVAGVVERFTDDLRRAGCSIEVRAVRPIVGVWDRMRLDQVVTNLVSNAIKYGRGEPIEVSVDDLGDRVELAVRDRGIGISPRDQARIFERFVRVSADYQSGFGLGLWIVKQIVDALGGVIAVDSWPGRGSTFRVTLPREMPLSN